MGSHTLVSFKLSIQTFLTLPTNADTTNTFLLLNWEVALTLFLYTISVSIFSFSTQSLSLSIFIQSLSLSSFYTQSLSLLSWCNLYISFSIQFLFLYTISLSLYNFSLSLSFSVQAQSIALRLPSLSLRDILLPFLSLSLSLGSHWKILRPSLKEWRETSFFWLIILHLFSLKSRISVGLEKIQISASHLNVRFGFRTLKRLSEAAILFLFFCWLGHLKRSSFYPHIP